MIHHVQLACPPGSEEALRAFYIGVLGLVGLAARLTAAGAPVHWADPAEIPGFRRFHTEDPHGNRLEFLANSRSTDHY